MNRCKKCGSPLVENISALLLAHPQKRRFWARCEMCRTPTWVSRPGPQSTHVLSWCAGAELVSPLEFYQWCSGGAR